MKISTFYAAVAAACLFSIAGCGEAPSTDETKKFDGEWVVLEMKQKGKSVDAKTLARNQVTFENAQYMRVEKSDIKVINADQYSVRTDFSKKPAEIDFVLLMGDDQGKACPGVYEFVDGKLKICMAELGGVRPTSFEPDAKGTFLLLERKK